MHFTRKPFPGRLSCRAPARRLLSALALAAVVAGLTVRAHADDSVWLDLEGRIQYGYYTEDARSLGNLVATLAAESGETLQHYYSALANYRLALVLTATDKNNAREAAERCVADLDRTLQDRGDFAEALALQSACLASLSSLKPWGAPFAGPKSNTQIDRALKLAPRNPRVLLLDATNDFGREDAQEREQAFAKLVLAVAAFEAERQGIERVPGWGAAEAYALLARGYLDKGDAVAARDALEHALLIAPEFASARRLMIQITSG